MSKFDIPKYLIIDVDGTMTDGGIYYDENGNELKKFNTRDAAGFFVARELGITLMVLTGRECKATEKRMKDLKVHIVNQNVKDKFNFLSHFMKENNLTSVDIGYIGDDLNDLKAMKLASFVGCPKDACEEIKQISSYVSQKRGGEGAVRDIISYLVGEELWKKGATKSYDLGT